MAVIRKLSDETVNLIAAGEVVEDPASAVKELVENSIDAASTEIVIEIEGGGFGAIRILDNGVGIAKEDLSLAFERHATSKISSIHDLEKLHFKGFRGEALSSIGSASKTVLTSKQEGRDVAHQLFVEGGFFHEITPSSRDTGTTVEVRSLFYNLPARRKFQKTAQASFGEIRKTVVALALSHPEVAFELYHEGELILKTTRIFGVEGSKLLQQRAKELDLGEAFERALEVDLRRGSVQIRGLLAQASVARANRLGQYLFINHRWISSPALSFAIKEAYGTRLEERKFPVFLLHLFLPPEDVDVNVHPQKKEVRFYLEAKLKETIQEMIREALQEPFYGATKPIDWNRLEPVSFQEERETFLPRMPEAVQELFQVEPVCMGVFGPFLLLKGEKILLLHLQRTFEKQLTQKIEREAVISQPLLFPEMIEVLPAEESFILSHLQELEEVGFSLHQVGKGHFSIGSIPVFLELSDLETALRSMLFSEQQDDVSKDKKSLKEVWKQRLAKTISLRKKSFVLEEALELWRGIRNAPAEDLFYLGLPLIVESTHENLESWFRLCKPYCKS